ncbi:hypothetical protein ACK2JT_000277 [Acinetobacter baumannii]
MTDLNKLRSEFEAYEHSKKPCAIRERLFEVFTKDGLDEDEYSYIGKYVDSFMQEKWDLWQKAKAQAVPENTEDWYLDEDEGLWLDHDGIDGTLCELDIGEVKPVKHKEYLITQSNTLYAARVWDSDDDHIAWKLFESEESALEAAAYCKQMYEASESGAEG